MSSKSKKAEIEVGAGNVFAQLDLPNPDERLRKARLMNVINGVITRRGLSQKDAAKLTGLDQADVSRFGLQAEIVAHADQVLDPNLLTLGFARRFTGYKRLDLLLRDPDRLARLLTHPTSPIQLVVAGKAHPADEVGKDVIRQWVAMAQHPELRVRLVDLDNNTAEDPGALLQWYKDHFGVTMEGYEPWRQAAGPTVFMPFASNTDHWPAGKAWMINFRVEDLDGFLAKLRQAGAIILGKLATHEFAIGGPSFDLPFPPARNPWNPEHISGGSSGGGRQGGNRPNGPQ